MTAADTLPTGTVTFLFTDIEGSTKLVERLGTAAWTPILEEHQRILRAAIGRVGGHEIKTEGDSFFVVFRSAAAAVAAAAEAQQALVAASWPDDLRVSVRMGLHTGEGVVAPDMDYIGLDVHRAARVAAAGYGGQVLITGATRSLVEHDLPPGVALRDLGEHRLKDLSRPERLAQLVIEGLQADFPVLKTLDATPNNLPIQLTSFLGREREIEEAAERLAGTRLLTLTGPGGTGKTRLALQVAGRVADRFPDGVYFVPLAPITEADLVAPTIAQEIGLPDRGGKAPVERLVEHLRDRRVLLVLDNFEQVVSAAPVVNELLSGAAQLSALVTTRNVLHLYGEQEYPVPPLEIPDPRNLPDLGRLSQYEAVALFRVRASAVRPDFAITNENAAAVAEICFRLDGLPLAIELAAARSRLLTPQAILTRLEHRLEILSAGAQDLPARQRTLRGAIAWSYDLLEESERRLFACLSAFVGGARLEAIESTCADDVGGDVFEVVASLLDKSLVRRIDGPGGESRFEMLETIREYATERLEESGGADALRRRHAELYLELAESTRSTGTGAGRGESLDRLEEEHDNLRAALTWAIEQGGAELAMRLCVALWRFWQMRGYLVEGAERTRQTLELPDCPKYSDLRLAALEALGGLLYWMADMEAAMRSYQETLELERARGSVAGEANALYNLSFTYLYLPEPDPVTGMKLAEQALGLFRKLDDRPGIAKALWAVGNAAYTANEPHRAREYALQALPVFRELDDRFLIGWALYMLAVTELIEGHDLTLARQRLSEALGLFKEAEDVSGYTLVLDAIAAIVGREGDLQQAARVSGAVVALERSTGTGLNPMNRELIGFDPISLRDDPETAAAWLEGERMSIAEIVELATRETEAPARA
jgi:predicted ATPase/class 3 adenylate cyclase